MNDTQIIYAFSGSILVILALVMTALNFSGRKMTEKEVVLFKDSKSVLKEDIQTADFDIPQVKIIKKNPLFTTVLIISIAILICGITLIVLAFI